MPLRAAPAGTVAAERLSLEAQSSGAEFPRRKEFPQTAPSTGERVNLPFARPAEPSQRMISVCQPRKEWNLRRKQPRRRMKEGPERSKEGSERSKQGKPRRNQALGRFDKAVQRLGGVPERLNKANAPVNHDNPRANKTNEPPNHAQRRSKQTPGGRTPSRDGSTSSFDTRNQ